MAVHIAMVAGLHASAKKCSHTNSIQTIKYLLPFIVDLEGLEYLSLLLSREDERDPSRHLVLRSMPRTVSKRIREIAADLNAVQLMKPVGCPAGETLCWWFVQVC
jgi:hypothetical protein